MSATALITGGQRGIGLGIARRLHGAGFAVAMASSSAEDAPGVRAALAELGAGARYYRHDLRDAGAAGALLARVEAEQGAVCSLIANAGIGSPVRGDLLDVTEQAFDQVMDVNLKGGFFLAQEAARRMAQAPPQPYRSIVFITSVSAQVASVQRAEYCISKAAAAMMAKLYAARLAKQGIGVFEVRPGITRTAMTAQVQDSYTAQIEAGLVPAGRWGEPDDVAAAVLPLVQGQLAFANGAVIAVDGGLSIHRL